MAAPPLNGQFAHREELAQSPHDAGEHDLGERIRPPEGRDNPDSVPEPGGGTCPDAIFAIPCWQSIRSRNVQLDARSMGWVVPGDGE
ncbi:hypothetical protein KIP88_29890 [Bradyrhizobium sp. SRL28]|uniref:hypothetical protein n=1 Tax=Bradyrhizobium sp. SRL28 TaxID=2836178 RepID=UPI001BDE1875|nr:hypothetical protein [Bradyrhizobium sp. SRL28]MBT1514706.1 hypothetical protein [Bradyrhizobium sp. SRL28]